MFYNTTIMTCVVKKYTPLSDFVITSRAIVSNIRIHFLDRRTEQYSMTWPKNSGAALTIHCKIKKLFYRGV